MAMDVRCNDTGGDPRSMMRTLCPVCMNPLRAVVYEYKQTHLTGFEVGPASKGPSRMTVDTYIRTEMFACGLERSRAYTEHGWRPYVYHQSKKCLNAQGMALALREADGTRSDIAAPVEEGMVDYDNAEKSKAVVPARLEDYEPEPIVWDKSGEPARSLKGS